MSNRKRYGLFDYISASPLKGQGVVGLIVGALLAWIGFAILEAAGAFEETNPFGNVAGFWTGAYLGSAFASPAFFAMTSRFWGKVVIGFTLIKAAFGGWIYMSGQSLSFLQYLNENTWLLFLLFIDGVFFLFSTFVIRHKDMGRLAGDDDPNARAAYTDLILQPITFNRWIVGSRMADYFQGQFARRLVTALTAISILLLAVFALFVVYHDFLTVEGLPQDAKLSEKLTALVGAWMWPVVQIIVFLPAIIMIFFQMSLRPLMALDHEPLDERQIQTIRFGHADGRVVSLAMLAIVAILAVLKTPSEIMATIAIVALFFAWLAPYFVMAWRLPDGDGSYEEDEDILEIDYA